MVQRGNCLCGKSRILMNLFEKDLNNGKLFHDKLFRRAYYFGIKIVDIENLIQDFYMSASKSIKNFRGDINESTNLSKDDRLGPYLGQGFNYRIRGFKRDKDRINLFLFSYKIIQEEKYSIKEEFFEEISKKEQIEKMMTAFQKLKQQDRMILSLVYFSGFKYREIAEQLGISVGGVSAELNTAKQRLRKLTSLVN